MVCAGPWTIGRSVRVEPSFFILSGAARETLELVDGLWTAVHAGGRLGPDHD